MNIVEFVAFTIAFLALTISFIKRQYDEYQRRQHPERYQAESEREEQLLREFLRSLEIDVDEEKPKRSRKRPPPPPVPAQKKVLARPKQKTSKRTVGKEFEFKSRFDEYEKKTAIEERELETHVGERFQEGYGQKIVSKGFRFGEKEINPYDIKEYKQSSQAAALLSDREALRKMVIMHEIIGTAKFEL